MEIVLCSGSTYDDDDELREIIDEILIDEKRRRPCDMERLIFKGNRLNSYNNPWGNFI